MTVGLLKLDIRREGRSWTGDEIRERLVYLDEKKMELIEGKLFWSDDDRLVVVALLLENLGLDAVVRLGDPMRWKKAVDALLAEATV